MRKLEGADGKANRTAEKDRRDDYSSTSGAFVGCVSRVLPLEEVPCPIDDDAVTDENNKGTFRTHARVGLKSGEQDAKE